MNTTDTTPEPGHGWDDYSDEMLLDTATKHPELPQALAAALELQARVEAALAGTR